MIQKHKDNTFLSYRSHLLILAIVAMATFVSGCAAAPENVAPAIVSSDPYRNISCGELRATLARAKSEQAAWEQHQRNDRVWDGLLNVLVIPGLGALTPDNSKSLAEAKGLVLALTREFERRCVKD